MATSKPRWISGGYHADDRGVVSFVNAFDLEGIRRSYVIRVGPTSRPRGWIGHRREEKWFWVVQGRMMIALVEVDDWARPSSGTPVMRHCLSAEQPGVLHVPGGWATAIVPDADNGVLVVFSTMTLEQSQRDDVRYPLETWPAEGGVCS